MLSETNTNNKINYKINVKKEEKKYSWSTVFAWLYLKTIGRLLPKRWNKWAENILYYDKATGNNGVQTDDLKTVDESIQIDLKPEVAEKESQSGVISKDGEGQTTFQDITMQTECVETTDKNIEVNLESERERELEDENEELERQLEGVNQALKAFMGLCDDQAQQIAALQLGNGFLEEENGELRSKLAELEKNYRELAEVADKRGEEFLAKLEEKSKEILKLNKELIECSIEFANKTERLSVEMEEKDTKINNLTLLSEGLGEGKKAMETKNEDLQAQVTALKENLSVKEKELIKQLEGVNQALKALTLSYDGQVDQMEDLYLEIDSLEEQNEELRSKNEKLEKHCVKLKNDIRKIFEGAEKKCMKINSLTSLNKGLYKDLQGENQELAGQKGAVKQLTKEQKEIVNLEKKATQLASQIENGLDEVKKLQEEKEELQGELNDANKRISEFNSKFYEGSDSRISQRNLPDKLVEKNNNLEHFLSDRNVDLKEHFPEFKEKNFLLNFLRENVKFLSSKQDDKFQGNELLNLFKIDLKELARKTIEDRVKEVVINKGNKYYQVSKNIDKELLDGTMRKDKLKTELLYSVKRCMKKLELDEKDAITITDSIMDKLCDKENSNKNPSALLKEIVVKELTEARMEIFLEKGEC